MKRICFLLMLLAQGFNVCCAQHQAIILEQPYSFIIADGEITRLQQHNDTLQWLHGRLYDVSQTKNLVALNWDIDKNYKIKTSHQQGNLWYVALERLDSGPLSADPLPEDRFSVHALYKDKDNGQQIGFVMLAVGLDEHVLEKVMNSFVGKEQWLFTTYYSDVQWKVWGELPSIATREQASLIKEKLQSAKVESWVQLYKKNPIKETYGTGLMTELLNRICIAAGWCPIVVSKALQCIERAY